MELRTRDVAFTVLAADVPPELQDIVRNLLNNALDIAVNMLLKDADTLTDDEYDAIAKLDVSWHEDV